MELAESSDGKQPLTLQDVINFAAACEHLGMRPSDITLTGGVNGFKARITGHGPLTRIVATGARLPTSTWQEPPSPRLPGLDDKPTTPMPPVGRQDAAPSL